MKVIQVCKKTIHEGQRGAETGFSHDLLNLREHPLTDGHGVNGDIQESQLPGSQDNWALVPVLQLITLWPQASLLAVRASLSFSFLICNVRTTNSIFKGTCRPLPSRDSTPGLLSGEGEWRHEGGPADVFAARASPCSVPPASGDSSLLDVCLEFHSKQINPRQMTCLKTTVTSGPEGSYMS